MEMSIGANMVNRNLYQEDDSAHEPPATFSPQQSAVNVVG
jgi:hypothetical protein